MSRPTITMAGRKGRMTVTPKGDGTWSSQDKRISRVLDAETKDWLRHGYSPALGDPTRALFDHILADFAPNAQEEDGPKPVSGAADSVY